MKINNFFTGTYEYNSRDVSARKLLNVYPESTQGQGKSDVILVGTPGQKRFSDFSAEYIGAGCRGLHWTSTNRLFGFFGQYLLEILPNGNKVERFVGVNYPTQVSFCDDGLYMLWVDGFSMYYMDLETNIVSAVDAAQIDFDRPTKIVYTNGRAIVINADDTIKGEENAQTRNWNRFYWSELRDIKTWNPLNFATAETSADALVSITVRDNDIWLFGERSYEIWRHNDQDPDLPYQYVGGSSAEIGCIAPNSVATISNSVCWLGSSSAGLNQIFISEGNSAKNITTNPISQFLTESINKTQDAIGFIYTQETHTFYVLTFFQLNRTFVYDLSTGLWHERSTRDEKYNIHNRWRVVYCTFAFNQIICADIITATLYVLKPDQYVDELNGNKQVPIVRIIQSGPINDSENNKEFQIINFEVDMETGTGLNDIVQGYNPQIMLQLSKDGGYSWGNELWRPLGKIGETQTRVQWRALGRARELTYRIQFSEPVKFLLINAFQNILPFSNRF